MAYVPVSPVQKKLNAAIRMIKKDPAITNSELSDRLKKRFGTKLKGDKLAEARREAQVVRRKHKPKHIDLRKIDSYTKKSLLSSSLTVLLRTVLSTMRDEGVEWLNINKNGHVKAHVTADTEEIIDTEESP